MKHYIPINILTILSLLLATGCSSGSQSESEPEPTPGPSSLTHDVSCSIATRGGMGNSQGSPEEASDNEKIQSYKIIFVGKTNREVAAVVERGTSTNPVYEEEFTVSLKDGSYDVYAVANINDFTKLHDSASTSDKTITYTGNVVRNFFENSKSGEKAPEDTAIKATLWDFPDALAVSDAVLVPMAGFNEVTISGANSGLRIEVVRLYAKLEFKFKLGEGVTTSATINEVTLHDTQTGSLLFMPDYVNLGMSPVGHLSENLIRKNITFSSDLNLTADVYQTVPPLYLHETIAPSNEANAFVFSVKMKRGAASESTDARQEIVQYAVADELQWINRNDHMVIPITITDWIFDVDVEFYPPIGGYPAVITQSLDEDHVSVTFGTPGRFVITPRLRRAGSSDPWLTPETGAFKIGSVEATQTSSPSIWTEIPKIDNLTQEIIGEVSTEEGRESLTIKVKVDGTNPATYTKTIYIIRKNPTD